MLSDGKEHCYTWFLDQTKVTKHEQEVPTNIVLKEISMMSRDNPVGSKGEAEGRGASSKGFHCDRYRFVTFQIINELLRDLICFYQFIYDSVVSRKRQLRRRN